MSLAIKTIVLPILRCSFKISSWIACFVLSSRAPKLYSNPNAHKMDVPTQFSRPHYEYTLAHFYSNIAAPAYFPIQEFPSPLDIH